ncbi:hypothetical protein QL093DRAFT_2356733 [Fusarium oxysporum]|nr:hypothetical protein QL093DRAFT_2356733 [Fusarium oxysporum]
MADCNLFDNLYLFYDTSARLLICTRESCKFALSNDPSRVTTHLRDKHNIPTKERRRLSRLLKSLHPRPSTLMMHHLKPTGRLSTTRCESRKASPA